MREMSNNDYVNLAREAIKAAWAEYFKAARHLRETYFSEGAAPPKLKLPKRLVAGFEKFSVRPHDQLSRTPLEYFSVNGEWIPLSVDFDEPPLSWLTKFCLSTAIKTPRSVWRLVHLIDQLTRWCMRATERVEQARLRTLRRQAKSVEKLEAYLASRML